MSSVLGNLLQSRLGDAKRTGRTQTFRLARGLRGELSHEPAELTLWRDDQEPSDLEVTICADALGWRERHLVWTDGDHGHRRVTVRPGPIPEAPGERAKLVTLLMTDLRTRGSWSEGLMEHRESQLRSMPITDLRMQVEGIRVPSRAVDS